MNWVSYIFRSFMPFIYMFASFYIYMLNLAWSYKQEAINIEHSGLFLLEMHPPLKNSTWRWSKPTCLCTLLTVNVWENQTKDAHIWTCMKSHDLTLLGWPPNKSDLLGLFLKRNISIFVQLRRIDRRTESDTYEPNVQLAQLGSKNGHTSVTGMEREAP